MRSEARASSAWDRLSDIRESGARDAGVIGGAPRTASAPLPALATIAALGLLIVTLSYSASRQGWPWAMLLFWVGVVVLYLPLLSRLTASTVGRGETIWLLVILAIVPQVMLVLRQPIAVTGYDEFLHWRTADDILRSGHLFTPNALLLVSPLFPGLEIVTSALVNLTGLSIAGAGYLLVGSAHLAMVLAIFLVFERLAGSYRLAGLGAAAYMGSSTFAFFDTQFAYESLGLPLVTFVVFLLANRSVAPRRERPVWSVLAALAMAATVVTHHFSALMLLAILVIWAAVTHLANLRAREGAPKQPSLLWPALLTFVLLVAWLSSVAQLTYSYLAPQVARPVVLAMQIFSGQETPRDLLVSSQGGVNYERYVGFASVAVIVVGLAFGLVRWWRHHRYPPLSLLLGIVALAYPALPALRLFDFTWEVSNRLSGFVFFGVGFVISLGLIRIQMDSAVSWLRGWLVPTALTVLLCGGIIAGSNPVTRLPGPYLPGADYRSMDLQETSAADWAATVLGPNNRIASDRAETVLMGSYGKQRAVTRPADGVDVSGIFLAPGLGTSQVNNIRQAKIRYIVVDRRISEGLPLAGYYFEKWEQSVVPFSPPVKLSVLDKFYDMPNVSCVYDSADIRIYDLGGLLGGS